MSLRSWACRRERSWLGWAAFASLVAGCGGERVVLGDRSPLHFGDALPVSELNDMGPSENPTLTADLREIYFTAYRPDGSGDVSGNVWVANRTSPDARFNAPSAVSEVNTDAFETSAAISADGLTLWLGSDRPGGIGDLDVWRATRTSPTGAWSSPVNVAELNSTARDLPRPVGEHGRSTVPPPSADA